MSKGWTNADGNRVYDGAQLRIVITEAAANELDKIAKHNRKSAKDVRKALSIMARLADFGRQSVANKEQFREEGSFSAGDQQNAKIKVFAVKSFQVRVYGGFKNAKDGTSFFCVSAVLKKKQKADNSELQRAAKSLGNISLGNI